MASLLKVSTRVVVVPITPHISEFRANYHDSLMSAHEKGAHISIANAWTRSCHCSNIFFFFLLFLQSYLTFFDKLHKHWVVTTDSEPKAIFIFLDDYTSLDQTCK